MAGHYIIDWFFNNKRRLKDYIFFLLTSHINNNTAHTTLHYILLDILLHILY
jgi:hypothetical protein